MNILIADNQKNVLSGLKLLLENEPDMKVVGEAIEIKSLLVQIKLTQPDILLLDWELGKIKTADIIEVVKLLCPEVKIVALSCRPESQKISINAGVDGFIGKCEQPQKILEAIRSMGKK